MFIPIMVGDILEHSTSGTLQVVSIRGGYVTLYNVDTERRHHWANDTYIQECLKLEVKHTQLLHRKQGAQLDHWITPSGGVITHVAQYGRNDWLWNNELSSRAEILTHLANVFVPLYVD